MTFILICGEQNSGKTSTCKKLRDMIELNANFKKCGYPSSAMSVEVLEHYENGGKHIVLYSPSDDNGRIRRLATYIDDFGAASETKDKRPDIIIATIRESGVYMSRMLALLEAIADNTTNLENHFDQNIAGITTFAPTAIKSHAFVLHLEEKHPSGTKEEQEKALERYCDDNADKAKYALDFALARL